MDLETDAEEKPAFGRGTFYFGIVITITPSSATLLLMK